MKITSLVLAEKIAALFNDAQARKNIRTAGNVLEAVPELAGFDTLADALQTFYQANQIALHDLQGEDTDAEEARMDLEGMRDEYAAAFRDAVGEDPQEPEILEDTKDPDDVEEIETAPNESEQ